MWQTDVDFGKHARLCFSNDYYNPFIFSTLAAIRKIKRRRAELPTSCAEACRRGREVEPRRAGECRVETQMSQAVFIEKKLGNVSLPAAWGCGLMLLNFWPHSYTQWFEVWPTLRRRLPHPNGVKILLGNSSFPASSSINH